MGQQSDAPFQSNVRGVTDFTYNTLIVIWRNNALMKKDDSQVLLKVKLVLSTYFDGITISNKNVNFEYGHLYFFKEFFLFLSSWTRENTGRRSARRTWGNGSAISCNALNPSAKDASSQAGTSASREAGQWRVMCSRPPARRGAARRSAAQPGAARRSPAAQTDYIPMINTGSLHYSSLAHYFYQIIHDKSHSNIFKI